MAVELVLDASVAAKLFFEEQGSTQAAELADAGAIFTAPDFIHVEFASIASTKVRRGEVSERMARDALASLPFALDRTVPAAPLTHRAFALAVSHGCSVYDGIYLALAEQRDCPVITADQRLIARVTSVGLSHLVQAL